MSLEDLVRRRTRRQRPPAVPELELHLADDMTSAWEDLERELGTGALAPPFWAFAWIGGQALARYVLDEPAAVRGLRVLDLATGSGLVALAARLAGASDVLAVDVDHVAVAAVGLNAALNGLPVRTLCADLTGGPVPDVDVLLAGDVLYDRDMVAAVLPWLQASADAGVEVLLGDPGRSYLPSTGLELRATHDVATTRDLEGADVRTVRVFRLLPAGEHGGPGAA